MMQSSNLNRVMDARDHFKNGACSKSQTSRENFFKKYGGFFVIGLTSLVLMIILYYLDEGIHKLPNNLRGIFEVFMGSIYNSILPVAIFILSGLNTTLKRFRLGFSFFGFFPILILIYLYIK